MKTLDDLISYYETKSQEYKNRAVEAARDNNAASVSLYLGQSIAYDDICAVLNELNSDGLYLMHNGGLVTM